VNLTDTGPLVALVNRNDPNHSRCVAATRRLPREPFLTTWPCFPEAMRLVFRAGGYPAQAEKYRDRPMDLADASLIVAAERLGQRRIFTLDGDFHLYRFADGTALYCMT
jgi:predicted nucleic acid-binding protein